MSATIENAKEAIEHVHHEHGHADEGKDNFSRNVAVMVGVLAAVLAIAELGEKGAQNAYLTYHITANDDWNFYQAKNIRSNIYSLHADLLESQPNAAEPAIRKRIDDARANSRRLDDDEKSNGRKQLMAKARASEALREQAFHRYHLFEGVVGALQISIVLSSVSIVAKVRPLAIVSGLMGIGAAIAGAAVALHLI
ncbi:MAG: DUF4337 domain-containing protein [Alphaproteobacteria bacterium]|nr:DUF4337 domain-containing protein [Alphaproteobacteria bacterium]